MRVYSFFRKAGRLGVKNAPGRQEAQWGGFGFHHLGVVSA
jgi:hypothetical protein